MCLAVGAWISVKLYFKYGIHESHASDFFSNSEFKRITGHPCYKTQHSYLKSKYKCIINDGDHVHALLSGEEKKITKCISG